MSPAGLALVDRIDAALPQTQCTRCGYPDCRRYAQAVADGEAINRCPPGGAAGIAVLATLTGCRPLPLDSAHGVEGPRKLAVIDEAWCIGCTLCIKACPVDCIVGASKLMHTVIDDQCTGCELCIPACPVDCISLHAASGSATGWQAWSPAQAGAARDRYAFRTQRLEREQREHDEQMAAKAAAKLADLQQHSTLTAPDALERKRALAAAAMARIKARRAG